MRTKVLLGAAVVLMLVVSVATIGSNMGFKISITLYPSQVRNYISIPYYNSYHTANDIWADLLAAGITPYRLSWYDASAKTTYNYTGVQGVNEWPVNEGQGFYVQISDTSNKSWIVVGSHDPSFQPTFYPSQVRNYFSVPYHTTWTTASQMWTDLQTAGMTPYRISWYDASARTTYNYTGVVGVNDFSFVPGQAVYVQISDATNKQFSPAHY